MKAQADVTITPRLMAEAFWEMSSIEQVEFFECLHDVVNLGPVEEGFPVPYGNGEMQWCLMAEDIRKNPKAFDMATSMTAFIFLASTRWLERW